MELDEAYLSIPLFLELILNTFGSFKLGGDSTQFVPRAGKFLLNPSNWVLTGNQFVDL